MNHFSVLVRSEKQLKIVQEFPVEDIYTDNYELALKYNNLYYQGPRTKTTQLPFTHLLVGDVGTLWTYQKKKEIITDYFLNVANHQTIDTLLNYGVKRVTLSIETTPTQIANILKEKSYPIELIIYGRIEAMTLKKHPIINQNGYELEDHHQNRYPLIVDKDSHVHLFSSKPINKLKEIETFNKLGLFFFRIDFLEEDAQEINKVLTECFHQEGNL